MLYDPYAVLGVEQQASKKEIKKAFKKIIKTKNPDRAKDEEEKKELNEYLLEVGKAYNLLKDGEKVNDLFKSDKDSEEVLAIPKAVVEKGWYLFVAYCIFVGIVFPWYGFKKWRESMKCNSLGVRYNTVEMFYNKMNNGLLGKEVITGVRNLIHVICDSEEIRSITKWKLMKKFNIPESKEILKKEIIESPKEEIKEESIKDEESLKKGKVSGSFKNLTQKKKMPSKKGKGENVDENDNKSGLRKAIKQYFEQNYGYPLKDSKYMGYYIFMDHLFRSEVFSPEDRKKVVDSVLKMIEVMKKIAIAKNLKDLLDCIFIVSRMVHQAVFDHSFSLMQYPKINFEDLILNGKIDKEGIVLPKMEIKNINAFVEKTSEESNSEASEQVSNFIVSNNIKTYKVEKEGIVTVKITLRRGHQKKENIKDDDKFILKMNRGERDLELMNAIGNARKTPVHSPFIYNENYLIWNVIFIFNGEILRINPIFADFEYEKDIYLEIESEKSGQGKLRIEVKNGQYFDVDCSEEITFEYV